MTIRDWLHTHFEGVELETMEPAFDSAIVGVAEGPAGVLRVVYDLEVMNRLLESDDGPEEVEEHLDYNIRNLLVRESSPTLLTRPETTTSDAERLQEAEKLLRTWFDVKAVGSPKQVRQWLAHVWAFLGYSEEGRPAGPPDFCPTCGHKSCPRAWDSEVPCVFSAVNAAVENHKFSANVRYPESCVVCGCAFDAHSHLPCDCACREERKR